MEEVVEWLESFQRAINEFTGSEHLQFTVEIWNPDAVNGPKPSTKMVTICDKKQFPYLDMELYWQQKELKFRVQTKEHQDN